MTRVSFLFATLLISGCITGEGNGRTRCLDNADCDGIAVCRPNGTCDDVECTHSNQCDLGMRCETTEHVCEAGCDNDNDCLAGEACSESTHQCEAYGCRDTQLDCHYGEFCNTETGQCYEDDREHCKESTDFLGLDCGEGTPFLFWDDNAYCLMPCSANDENACPRGYECRPDGLGGNYCNADCPTLNAASSR